MKCPRCGAENPDNYAFCAQCGSPLKGQASPASPAPQEAQPAPRGAAEGDAAGVPYGQRTPVTVSAGASAAAAGEPASGAGSVPRSATETAARPVASPDQAPDDGHKGRRKDRKRDRKKDGAKERGGRHTGRFVLVILVLVAALGATGYFAWTQIQRQDQEIADLKAQVEEQQSQASSEKDGASATSSSGASATTAGTDAGTGIGSAKVSGSGSTNDSYTTYGSYKGTWTGKLQEEQGLGVGSHNCYGASDKPLVLDFKDISDSGQATVVATVLYHGHKSTELSNDAASAEGDSYLTTDPITTTFDPNYGFEFNYTPGGDGTKVEVKATPVQSQSDNATQFKVEVTSTFANQAQFRDTYTITKSA